MHRTAILGRWRPALRHPFWAPNGPKSFPVLEKRENEIFGCARRRKLLPGATVSTPQRDTPRSTFWLIAIILKTRYRRDVVPDPEPQIRPTSERFGDNPALAGFGAGDFGPTTRSVARLVADLEEQAQLLNQVIVAVDRQGLLQRRARLSDRVGVATCKTPGHATPC
ncbi:MAG: hypothetical protein ACI88C_000343 [Acidimicrobiales bacterium]|jgi:hypothetical protein